MILRHTYLNSDEFRPEFCTGNNVVLSNNEKSAICNSNFTTMANLSIDKPRRIYQKMQSA